MRVNVTQTTPPTRRLGSMASEVSPSETSDPASANAPLVSLGGITAGSRPLDARAACSVVGVQGDAGGDCESPSIVVGGERFRCRDVVPEYRRFARDAAAVNARAGRVRPRSDQRALRALLMRFLRAAVVDHRLDAVMCEHPDLFEEVRSEVMRLITEVYDERGRAR